MDATLAHHEFVLVLQALQVVHGLALREPVRGPAAFVDVGHELVQIQVCTAGLLPQLGQALLEGQQAASNENGAIKKRIMLPFEPSPTDFPDICNTLNLFFQIEVELSSIKSTMQQSGSHPFVNRQL